MDIKYEICHLAGNTYYMTGFTNIGIYKLTEFVVDDQFEGDYFDARFFYDVSKLNKDKIVTSIAHEPEEMENGGFKMTLQLPYGYEGYDKISI